MHVPGGLVHWGARQRLHQRSAPIQGCGVALPPAASALRVWPALWVWPAFLLVDQRDAYRYRTVSDGELITGWPQQLATLAVSAPLSVPGAALLVGGSVHRRTSAHSLRIIETRKSEDRSRSGGK
ncbi:MULTISPECIES: hypothetical protein [unclassified Streptomyces]|uniref:hypothetical protein n=1 Tax=unclassified Streptomyces TaxID=2593676 RepID=UPI0038138485